MGYFDALTAAYFKTSRDGRKLFFPWGAWSRGYLLPSDEQYQRLRRQLLLYTIVLLAAIIGTSMLYGFVVSLALAAFITSVHALWMRSLTRGLASSDEKLSLQESMTNQARTYRGWGLWVMEIASLLFVAGGIGMLIASPGEWLAALFAIVFFGLCAIVFARMLVLRRAAAS